MYYRINSDIQQILSKQVESSDFSGKTFVSVSGNDFTFYALDRVPTKSLFQAQKDGYLIAHSQLCERARRLATQDRNIFDDKAREIESSQMESICKAIKSLRSELETIAQSEMFEYIYSGNQIAKWDSEMPGLWSFDHKSIDWITSAVVVDDIPDILTNIILLNERYVTDYLEDVQKNHPERDKVQAFLDLPTKSWKYTRGTVEDLL